MSADSPQAKKVAVVLAAGKGTRMRSALPKVLHPVAGKPMLAWVLAAAREAGCDEICVVVGHGAEEVRETFAGQGVRWVLQEEQLGTGHAVLQAEDAVPPGAEVLVLSGDVPLLRAETLHHLSRRAAESWGSMAVAKLDQPGRLGRVMTAGDGRLDRIVEAADATPHELEEKRVNAGIYCLPAHDLFERLKKAGTDNAQGEIYLTEALNGAVRDGERVELVELDDPSESWGVNDRAQLGQAHRRMLERHAEELMAAGVTILDPARTVVEPGVRVGRDSVLHPGVTLLGATVLGEGTIVHQGAWIRDGELAPGVTVHPYTVIDGARVGSGSQVGPFARLRPEAQLDEDVRIGNFVEVKKSHLGPGAKASHLAYLGDATVGAGANVGAGVVTCNYDGKNKHRTKIGAGAFIGSDTMLVAPVSIGAGATTAAGSVITHDVPDGDLGVGRGRQRNVAGWAERLRKKQAAAARAKTTETEES